jgi:hypothetical protein
VPPAVYREILGLPVEDQVEALLRIPRELPVAEAGDPSAWAQAVVEVFARAVEEARRRGQGGASESLASLERELEAHAATKPKDKKGKPFGKWKRTKEDLARRIELARAQEDGVRKRAAGYAAFVDWLGELLAGESPAQASS